MPKPDFAMRLRCFPNPSGEGETVHLDAALDIPDGSITPTGAVVFRQDDAVIGTATIDSMGRAFMSLVPTGFRAGVYAITARYEGDTNFAPVDSDVSLLTVERRARIWVELVSPGACFEGQSLFFKATMVTDVPGALHPTGDVIFKHGATPIGTASLGAWVSASLITGEGTFRAGVYPITAHYAGDATFSPVRSAELMLTVEPGARIWLNRITIPPMEGQSVHLSASMDQMGTLYPTGEVTFKAGDSPIGTTTIRSPGMVGLDVFTEPTALRAGVHQITAHYHGDVAYSPVTSDPLTVRVREVVIGAWSSVSPSTEDQPVTLTAIVHAPSVLLAVTGTITFREGDVVLGAAMLDSWRRATILVPAHTFRVGVHRITACYGGDAVFSPASSEAFTHTVHERVETTN